MANRVTEAEVKVIIETSLTLTPFIEAANTIINDRLLSSGLSEATLTKIELFLSAHLTTLRERQVSREKIGDAETTYEGRVEMGLNSSLYGQTAQLLDTTGTLAGAKNGLVASIQLV